jgi:hypothetical protein
LAPLDAERIFGTLLQRINWIHGRKIDHIFAARKGMTLRANQCACTEIQIAATAGTAQDFLQDLWFH